ncbi:MAG: ABC transporter permease, partial [Eubacteriales bacterium]
MKKVLSYLGVLIFWVGVWWVAAWRVDEAILLPDPFSVVRRLFALAATSGFWRVVMTSLLRILAGILI